MEPKTLQSAADLDVARCRGDWANVPELARRYKKYHPSESTLEATARLEAEFAQLLMQVRHDDVTSKGVRVNLEESMDKRNAQRKSMWGAHSTKSTTAIATLPATPPPEWMGSDDGHRYDNPDSISLPPQLAPEQTDKILKRLQELVQKYSTSEELQSADERQAQFTKIIIARIFFETGRYAKALESLQMLALRKEDVHAGYGMVLLVQARVIKGMCFEQQGDITSALEAYGAAWDVVDQRPSEKGEMLSFWIEECLYRAILLHTRTQSAPRQALRLMRGYMHLASSHWSSFWRMHKRWIVFRCYGQHLIRICKDGSYYPMTITSAPLAEGDEPDLATKRANQTSAYEELLCLTALYRNVLSTLTPRLEPRALSGYVLELANFIVDAHDVIGWGEISNIKRILQFFTTAKEKTFNSACLTRHTFFVHLRIGTFDEAKLAFRTYMELVGLPDVIFWGDAAAQADPDHDILPVEKVNRIYQKLQTNQKLHTVEDEATADQLGETENEQHIIQVLLAATQLFGRELDQGKPAASIADIAVEMTRRCECSSTLVAECYRVRGTAYGIAAQQSHLPEQRSNYHREALASLEYASKLDEASWQIHYELALQQAQMKDVVAAATHVGKAIQLNPKHLPSWHLLALIYSCKRLQQLPLGMQTLEAGLQECSAHYGKPPATVASGGLPILSLTNDETDCQTHMRDSETYLRARLTQLSFLESIEGPETALKLYHELFGIYAKLSHNLLGATVAAAQSSESIKQLASNGNARRKSSATNDQRTPVSSNSTSSRSRSKSNASNYTSKNDAGTEPIPPLPTQADPSQSDELHSQRRASSGSGLDKKSTKEKSTRKKSFIEMTKRLHSSHSSSTTHIIPSEAEVSPTSPTTPSTSTSLTKPSSRSLAPSLTPSFSMASMRSNSNASILTESTAPKLDAPLPKSTVFAQVQRQRWQHLLTQLWLQSTRSFVKAHRIEEASKAMLEAEQLGLMDAYVWHQLGNVCIQASETRNDEDLVETALEAYKKALSLDHEHVQTHVDMAAVYMRSNEWELAEGLLDRITQGPGWDHAQAWFLLGNCYKQQHCFERAKDCLLYALDLSETTPITSFSILPRFV